MTICLFDTKAHLFTSSGTLLPLLLQFIFIYSTFSPPYQVKVFNPFIQNVVAIVCSFEPGFQMENEWMCAA